MFYAMLMAHLSQHTQEVCPKHRTATSCGMFTIAGTTSS
jgi:hypothetical protein